MSEYRLEKFWDDISAVYKYSLISESNMFQGDEQWAIRQSEHYSIEMPTEETK